ncbi:MAG: response regulator [Desulfobacterales bacterium]|nr:response regulator [Desulfobacterales bacterium]
MMEAMEDPVSICSSDYRIEYMNPAMIKRVGRDATGETCFKAIHGLKEKCPWCIADKTQQGISFKTDIVSPLDNRSYHISHSPVIYKDDTISKMTVFSDTTNLKKIEAQLQQSQKMESIGTLAGGIAHDFNNILFPIMGRTEMLLQDIPEDSPFHASLNEIFTSALRASDLVKQILTFSRQDTNELSLMKIQPVIKEALKLIRSTIPTTIEIKQYIRNDCGAIKADPTQIHQVVMNLTTNAYHAMEKAGGELKVTLKEIQLGDDDVITPDIMPGVYACLTIADTGTGMDKNILEKIFDPFFTTKKQGKGTGMGLSVVHGIVNSMGGAIQAYSEPGKGTEFKVYFPVEKSSFEKHSTQTKEPVRGGTERILLVDDEEAIIAMEKQILEHLGYQVTSRTSSIEALEAFRANPDKFDLVITDMAMPNMSGDKLAAGLIEIRSDIPILLCTGFSGTISEEKAASLGMKGFILKPIVMKDLANKIREVLGEN